MCLEPMKLGYADQQFPDWAAKLQAGQGAEAPPDAGAIPENAPTRIAVARKLGAGSMGGSMHGSMGGQPTDQHTSQHLTLQNANAAAFEAANKVLGESGQHIEALGSDAVNRWMQENGILEMNGAYWQKLPTGQLALVHVQHQREVIEAEQLGDAEVSSLMYRTLRVLMSRSLPRWLRLTLRLLYV
jgi:hypothetical protein